MVSLHQNQFVKSIMISIPIDTVYFFVLFWKSNISRQTLFIQWGWMKRWSNRGPQKSMLHLDPYVQSMAITRVLSSIIEMSAALLMIHYNQVESSIRINAFLGLIGPLILLTSMAIGLAGMAGKISLSRVLLIVIGVFLILRGTRG